MLSRMCVQRRKAEVKLLSKRVLGRTVTAFWRFGLPDYQASPLKKLNTAGT